MAPDRVRTGWTILSRWRHWPYSPSGFVGTASSTVFQLIYWTSPSRPRRLTRKQRRQVSFGDMTVRDTEADPLPAVLIERSGELKRQLVRFAQGPRFEPELRGKLLEVAGDDMTMDDATWIRTVDDFIFGYRFPDGTTILDAFIQENRDLPAAEREMLQGWSMPVDGIFELRRKHEDSLSVLNLIDDLEGMLSSYPQAGAQEIAKVALETATKHANLAFRNPLIVERGWEAVRRHRELFIEFFGNDDNARNGGEIAATT